MRALLPCLLGFPFLTQALLAADTPPLPTVTVTTAWLTHRWTNNDKGTLDHDDGTLRLSLQVIPAVGWRVVGTPALTLRVANAADGSDLRRRSTAREVEPLDEDTTRFVSLALNAPTADSTGGWGLAELAGTLTVRVAPEAPKEAVFSPLDAWIGRNATLAGEAGTEIRFTHDEQDHRWIEFNSEAAVRFIGMTLTNATGGTMAVDNDSDGTNDSTRMAYRELPSPLPEGASLTLRFVSAPQTVRVPFRFAPLALPSAPKPETVPLVTPQPKAQITPVPVAGTPDENAANRF